MKKFYLYYLTNYGNKAYIKVVTGPPSSVYTEGITLKATSEIAKAKVFTPGDLDGSGYLQLFTKEEVKDPKFIISYVSDQGFYFAIIGSYSNKADGTLDKPNAKKFDTREEAAAFIVRLLTENNATNRRNFNIEEV